jgi:hypothetical protein
LEINPTDFARVSKKGNFMTKQLFYFLGITLSVGSAFAVVKFDGKTSSGQNCVVRILSEVNTTSGVKKLVQVENVGGAFVGQSSLMVDMSGKGLQFRAIETVQRGSAVYNNLFISEDGKTMSYTSDLVTKSYNTESILECNSVK